jgi:uncharacterized protein (DUF58 family)
MHRNAALLADARQSPARIVGGDAHETLRRLELAVTRRLDGFLQGDHLGLVPGHGTDPGETRSYTPGDDVRRIDWNVTARTNEVHIRETIADRELETWVLADLSPSLDFGTADCRKRDLALAAAGAVGFLTARTGNRIGSVTVAGGDLHTTPARGGRRHLQSLLHQLISRPDEDGGGTTDLAAAIDRVGRVAKHRGLVVVVSDFLAPPGWEHPLRMLATRHEVLAVEVLDPRELELPAVGMLDLIDPESGRRLEVPTNSRKVRERYAAAAAEQRAHIADSIRAAGADHLRLRTDSDWLGDIIRFVHLRRRRAAAFSIPGPTTARTIARPPTSASPSFPARTS